MSKPEVKLSIQQGGMLQADFLGMSEEEAKLAFFGLMSDIFALLHCRSEAPRISRDLSPVSQRHLSALIQLSGTQIELESLLARLRTRQGHAVFEANLMF